MKSGARALGVAESYRGVAPADADSGARASPGRRPSGTSLGDDPAGSRRTADQDQPDRPTARSTTDAASVAGPRSVLAGAVVRADRVVDGLAFETCTVGATDATEAVVALVRGLDREDVRSLLLAGIAPAWFNLLDLHRIHEATGLPTLSVSSEGSPGLSGALREQFSGEALATRLALYDAQPPRHRVEVNGEEVWVRHVGCADSEDAAEVVRAFTPVGGWPDPLRVARLAARAGRRAFVDQA